MKIKGLDGQEHSWSLVKKPKGKVSQYHMRARKLLKKLFPFDEIFEEQSLPGSRTSKNGLLRCDFYIHSRRLMIEVQGSQHEEFNSFFHKNKTTFYQSQGRDNAKREWCQLNDINLVELPYEETDEQWTERIDRRGEIEHTSDSA